MSRGVDVRITVPHTADRNWGLFMVLKAGGYGPELGPFAVRKAGGYGPELGTVCGAEGGWLRTGIGDCLRC